MLENLVEELLEGVEQSDSTPYGILRLGDSSISPHQVGRITIHGISRPQREVGNGIQCVRQFHINLSGEVRILARVIVGGIIRDHFSRRLLVAVSLCCVVLD